MTILTQWIALGIILLYVIIWIIMRQRQKRLKGNDGCDGCADNDCVLRDIKIKSARQARESADHPDLSQDRSHDDKSTSRSPDECQHKQEGRQQ